MEGRATDPIRILLADDHTLFRLGMRALLASVPDTELIGEAATGDEAVELAARLGPDVILMDIKMPGMNGIEATRRIARADPRAGVIVLTMFEDDDSVYDAIGAGARGYVLKGADEGELLRVIRAVDQRIALPADGTAVTAKVEQPGAVAVLTFAGQAGQRVFVEVSSTDLPSQCGLLDLRGPDGAAIESGCVINGKGGLREDGTVLPQTGTYQLIVDPADRVIGTAQLRLRS